MIADRTSENRKRFIFDGVYQVLATVGHGRTSIVYKARRLPHPDTQRADNMLVALKVLTGNSKDPEFNLARMKREAVAMLSSRHPNVVRLIDFVTAGDLCYLCMEYADRGDLGAELSRQGRALSSDVAVRLITQVASGLECVHRAGILHRDIKPENLLLTLDGRVKLADFGIAKLPLEVEADDTKRGVGTFDYLAPECLTAADCSPSSDLYSAAVTLYQLVTNHLPFAGTSFTQSIDNKMSGRRTPLAEHLGADLPKFEEFFDKALATEPTARFQNAVEFKQALSGLLSAAPRIVTATGRQRQSLVTIDQRFTETTPVHTDKSAYLERAELADAVPADAEPALRPTLYMRRSARPAFVGAAQAAWKSVPAKQRALYLAVPCVCMVLALLLRLVGSSPAIASSDAGADRLFKRAGAGSTLFSGLFGGNSAEEQQIFGATDREKSGMLFDLLSDQSHIPLAAISVDLHRALFVIGLPGASPQVVSLDRFAKGEEVKLASNGLDLSLWINNEPRIEGAVVSGRYRENGSGREGSWVLSK